MTQFHKHTTNISYDFATLVGMGRVRNAYSTIKFAAATAIGVTERDVWMYSTDLVYLNTPELITVVSDSLEDNVVGTGAYTVCIKGLDVNWNLQEEIVTLTGITAASTTNSYRRILHAYIDTSATIAGAAGNITCKASTSLTVQAYIAYQTNQTLMSHFTTPANMVGLIFGATLGAPSGKSLHFHIKVKDATNTNKPFLVERAFALFETSLHVPMPIPRVIPPMHDYKFTAKASSSGTNCTVDYNLMLVDASLINIPEATFI